MWIDSEKAAADAAKKAADDWQRTADDINRSLTDALLRGFESGKSFAKVLRDTVVNMFKTLVLRPIISAVLSPVSGALSGLVGGGAGGASSAISAASNAYSLYNAGSQAYTLGSQYLAGSMSGANVLGSTYANFTGTGIDGLLATNGAYGTAGAGAGSPWAAAAGPAAAAAAIAAVVLNAVGAFRSERRVGSGLMGTLGKGDLSPFEEWREGGTLFSGPSYNTFNPVAELEARRKQLQDLKDSGQGDTQRAATLQLIVDSLEAQYGDLADQAAKQSKSIQTAYDALRTNVGNMADVLGLGSEAVRKFTTTLGGADGKGLNFEGLNGDQIAAKISEALSTANNELAQQIIGRFETTTTRGTRIVSENLGSQGEDASVVYSQIDDPQTTTRYIASEFARDGEKAIDTLTRLATSLSTVNAIWDQLGTTLIEASLAGGDLASSIADAFGGLDAFRAATASYFQNFYSATEQREALRRQLASQFEDLGLALPDIDSEDARDQFRALAESQDLTTEAGRKAYAALLQLSGAFASVTGAAEDAAVAIEQERTAARDNALSALERAIAKEKEALQAQIDVAARSQTPCRGCLTCCMKACATCMPK
jgi:hypothetical protein